MANARTRREGNYEFFDLQPTRRDMLEEVVAGLSAEPKRIAPKFFYDERGSELFEAITELPEYYLTRTEMELFDRHGHEMAEAMQGGDCVVEFGSGSNRKIRKLLQSVQPDAYVPVDISREHLQDNAMELHGDYPWLEVYPTCADFTGVFALPPPVQALAKVGFFPGSSIGNFDPDDAVEFLVNAGKTLGAQGRMLVGVDTKKSRQTLEAAYNDATGITAQFNENLLHHINDALDANFVVERFTHQAHYDEEHGRIQMFLESDVEQTVQIGAQQFRFDRGETVHTENSYKYRPEEFEALANAAGFHVTNAWMDERQWFGLYLLEASAAGEGSG